MKKLFTKLAVIALSAVMVLTITPGTLMADDVPAEAPVEPVKVPEESV